MIATTDRLDRYWADELGCETDALYRGGISACAPSHRDAPRWMGWMIPLECIVTDRAIPGTGVLSITPALLDALHQFLQPNTDEVLPPSGRALFPFLRAHFPHGAAKVHRVLHCPASTFLPAQGVFPISELSPDDLHASWYRLHFDGPIFVARDTKGSIASWAAIKCKSPDVWEMAVVTEARYRGMGLARSVVSRATEAALETGKVALYLHDLTNLASSAVCRSLGYQPYGYELTCECGRVMPRR